MLDRHDTARTETAPIPAAVDTVNDRRVVIAGAEKIGVQGVRQPVFDRVTGRQQGLGQNLSAKNTLGADVAAYPAKQVVFERFQLHQPEELIKGF